MADAIGASYAAAIEVLQGFPRVQVTSRVPGKQYDAFEGPRNVSRPVNRALFDPNLDRWIQLRAALDDGGNVALPASGEITKTLYSMAIAFCVAIDLLKERDQKTPGTFFEYFTAFFFAWRVRTEPVNRIRVLNIDDENTELPTDYLFNLGPGMRKFHMPIKTSTRERAIMLWAHQRLLDGVYGTERFMGTPVLLAETKMDRTRREVVEICTPEQWRLYQMYIARLQRVYYLDPPTAYAALATQFPPLHVKPFGDFFHEWNSLAPV
ncbi:hypothetical protein [Burkholderia sp. PAMC 28687]|uniref:hypothetical protein n=1 Tax=Burkholderia sp. PAMC 28687 TaxID=1795874 RepID=UPI0012D7252B|nr:hypothetical protein [Burkholderia sp. PAMC 28687]